MSDVPAGPPEASPSGRRGLRVLLVLLLVASGAAVLALAILGPTPDVMQVRDRVLLLDGRAEEEYRLARRQEIQSAVDAYLAPSGSSRRTATLGQVISRRVLPLLRTARAAVDGLTEVREADRPLVERLRTFTAAREAAYVALIEALRSAGAEATVASRTRMEEADRLRAEIESLDR